MGENLVDSLHKNDMFYFVLVSLISSDSILCKEDAEKSMESLKHLEEELELSLLSAKMKNKQSLSEIIYKYERVSFSRISFVGEDLGHNRKGENYRQVIERMAKDGFSYKGYMPVRWEDGKPTDVDLIFEHPGYTENIV